jgi:hypothetical protein
LERERQRFEKVCRKLDEAINLRGVHWYIIGTLTVRRTPSFRPLSAENKMDSGGLLSWLRLFVCCSLCALNSFGKERTSRAWHHSSSLSRLIGFQYLLPKAV